MQVAQDETGNDPIQRQARMLVGAKFASRGLRAMLRAVHTRHSACWSQELSTKLYLKAAPPH